MRRRRCSRRCSWRRLASALAAPAAQAAGAAESSPPGSTDGRRRPRPTCGPKSTPTGSPTTLPLRIHRPKPTSSQTASPAPTGSRRHRSRHRLRRGADRGRPAPRRPRTRHRLPLPGRRHQQPTAPTAGPTRPLHHRRTAPAFVAARRPRLGDGLPGRQERRRDPGLRRHPRRRRAPGGGPGRRVTYSSASSFGDPPGRAGRAASTSRTADRRAGRPRTSPCRCSPAAYPEAPDSGVPYQLFSADLPAPCSATAAAAASRRQPVPGGQPAAAGLRCAGRLPELLPARRARTAPSRRCSRAPTSPASRSAPDDFELAFAGATPDLAHVVLSTCAALTADATEVAGPRRRMRPGQTEPLRVVRRGADADQPLPATAGTAERSPPRAAAISADGSRVYFDRRRRTSTCAKAAPTKQVDEGARGRGDLPDRHRRRLGRLLHQGRPPLPLRRRRPEPPPTSPPRRSAGRARRLRRRLLRLLPRPPPGSSSGPRGNVDRGRRAAPTPATTRRPPAPPGSAPTAAAALRLLRPRTDRLRQPNIKTGASSPRSTSTPRRPGTTRRTRLRLLQPDRRTAARPLEHPRRERQRQRRPPDAYKPRVLSADGSRVFFDTATRSARRTPTTTRDVYEWEAHGTGSCAKAGGCVALISSGRAEGGATFVDASADGSDAFFLTDASLVPADPGASTSTTPASAAASRSADADPLLRRRLPAAAARTRRPDPGTAALEAPGNPPLPRRQEAARAARRTRSRSTASASSKKSTSKQDEREGARDEAPCRLRRLSRRWSQRSRSPRSGCAARRRPGRLRLPPGRRRLRRHRDRRRRRPTGDPGRLPSLLADHRINFNSEAGELLRRRPPRPAARPAAGADRKPDRGAAAAAPTQLRAPRASRPSKTSLSGESCPDGSQIGIVTVHTSHGGGETRPSASSTWPRRRASRPSSASPPSACRSPSRPTCAKPTANTGSPSTSTNFSQQLDVYGLRLTIWGNAVGGRPRRRARQLPQRGRARLRPRQMLGRRSQPAALHARPT